MGKLSATAVRNATKPNRLGDGDGLLPGGSKNWVCRVQKHSNSPDFGIESAAKVSLARTHDRARGICSWVKLGLNPVFERRKAEGFSTFKEATANVLAAQRKTWRNENTRANGCARSNTCVSEAVQRQVSELTGPTMKTMAVVRAVIEAHGPHVDFA
ncbi:integrase arm-type DNA-binding domain-containing protein [Novosphingobium gossypii]|uniref:integrase arm-type DNA-binding domain-containing protein n=1 Tax=Novosphingobium gossypii TaxID=1604774 RepID=UPI003D1B9BA5